MGIFDFLKPKPATAAEQPAVEPRVPVEQTSEGHHGDHWAGVFGFAPFYEEQTLGEQLMQSFTKSGEDERFGAFWQRTQVFPPFEFAAIAQQQNILTAFPVLKTTHQLAFQTKKIREWAHTQCVEAQLEGGSPEGFGLSFFATDYLKNKNRYYAESALSVCLSAIVFVAAPPPADANLSEDFVGYLPNGEYQQFSVFDYVGKILGLQEIAIPEWQIDGYVAQLRLIAPDGEKELFVLDTYIARANMEVESLSIGDRIAGALWIQGCLA